jgi:hypothetical protein
MGMLVINGAQLQCTLGAAPSVFSPTPGKMVKANKMDVGNIMDFAPMTNIKPFGMCNSTTNPQVIVATAAAQRVHTPMPCVPVTSAPWTPGSPTVMVGKQPALTDSCKLLCNWGGQISILPGTPTAKAP